LSLLLLSLLRDTQLAVSGVALFVVFVLSIISRRAAISACIFHQRLRKCHGERQTETQTTRHWHPNCVVYCFLGVMGALAPWATAEMVEERAGKLEEAIEAAKASGGCDQAVRSLETELKHQNKKGAEPQSVLGLIEGTKNYISRAEKRHIGITEQIVALQEQQAEIDKELRKARTRLADMEAEAAKQLNMQPKLAENTSSGLEDAVRMLLVAMHACQTLPPNLAEACAAVSTCLPQPGVSEDVHEMATDGGVNLKEEDVPAGQLDVALPSGSSERTLVGWEAPLSGKREELESCETDEQFLAWAKAAKRSRPSPY
jgi:F0F1-type ATP synthase membrane subunit b/b'